MLLHWTERVKKKKLCSCIRNLVLKPWQQVASIPAHIQCIIENITETCYKGRTCLLLKNLPLSASGICFSPWTRQELWKESFNMFLFHTSNQTRKPDVFLWYSMFTFFFHKDDSLSSLQIILNSCTFSTIFPRVGLKSRSHSGASSL